MNFREFEKVVQTTIQPEAEKHGFSCKLYKAINSESYYLTISRCCDTVMKSVLVGDEIHSIIESQTTLVLKVRVSGHKSIHTDYSNGKVLANKVFVRKSKEDRSGMKEIRTSLDFFTFEPNIDMILDHLVELHFDKGVQDILKINDDWEESFA